MQRFYSYENDHREHPQDVRDAIDMLYQLCHDGKRFIPKRSLSYIKNVNYALWEYITSHTSETSIPHIVVLLSQNWESILCKTCKTNPVILKGLRLYDYCSISCTIKSSDVQNKTSRTCKSKYGKRFNCDRGPYDTGAHHAQRNMINIDDLVNHDVMSDLQKKTWVDVAKHFNLTLMSHSSAYKLMRKAGYNLPKNSGTSNMEKELAEYVKSLVGDAEVITNTKSVIAPYELDVYLPKYNLAIEFNGLYYHSAGTKSEEKPDRHLIKTEMCNNLGIQLLHIFENEWVCKPDIWKSVIRSKLKLNTRIYARNTVVKSVSNQEAADFCEANHLQGSCVASFSKGLYDDMGNLLMVATFGKARYSKARSLELLRLCSLKGYTIVGGASKLLKGMSFISYANRRWSNGGVYESIGMTLSSISKPCYWYIDRCEVFHRSSYMKHKLNKKLPIFDPARTEVENCYANKLRRIWDCGNFVYLS